MEKAGKLEPHQIKDGFYGSAPYKRILVALAGPTVNIVFALAVFSVVYFLGGRLQSFSQHTKIIGYVEPKSEIARQNIKNGDRLETIDHRKVRSFQDMALAAVLNKPVIHLTGEHVDYFKGLEVPFSVDITPYADPELMESGLKSIGLKSPAQYLIYDRFDGKENPLFGASPMLSSGIQYGDRIVWANGELIFSLGQLSNVLNDTKVLLTVKRGNKTFLTRVPRFAIADLRLSNTTKEDLGDWQHALQMKQTLSQLSFIPYEIDTHGVIVRAVPFIDERSEENTVYKNKVGQIDLLLKKGDKILAIGGESVTTGIDIFSALQRRSACIIVQRGVSFSPIGEIDQDQQFIKEFETVQLSQLISTIGLQKPTKTLGQFVLLNPVQPLTQADLTLTAEQQKAVQEKAEATKKYLDGIKDPKKKAVISKQLLESQGKLFLGISLQDRKVVYNPTPLAQAEDVLSQTKMTLSYLFSGELSPKWLSGPVGIMQVMHHGISLGFKEALYWLGLVSMNLAIFNLLPIPVLDGGHIVFSLYEWITRKRIQAKIMEKIMIPFVVLLVGMLVFVTFQDLSRLFSRFF